MGKKLRELAGGVSENELASTVKESAQQIWLAGLGAFAKAQEEGGKVFDALVKEGESIQAKTRKMTDERIAQVAGTAAGTWDRLEQVFEDRVARALGSLGVPSKQDIDRLSRRVIELSAAVQALTEGKAAPRVVAKPAVKEAATAAEPAAAKPAAAKPAAAKPAAAKPAAAKPAAAKPAAAKPAAAKPAAAKPAAAKPATAAAKPAARRPAAKAASTKPVPPVTPADVLNTIPQPSE